MIKLFLLLVAFVSVGCTSITPDQKAALREASGRYATVTKEMTKAQIVSVLGAPQKESAQISTWEAHANERNYEALVVEFDPVGNVEKITRVTHRYSFGPIGHAERWYEYAKNNKPPAES